MWKPDRKMDKKYEQTIHGKKDLKMILKLTGNAHFVGHKRNANYSYIGNKIS